MSLKLKTEHVLGTFSWSSCEIEQGNFISQLKYKLKLLKEPNLLGFKEVDYY